MTIEIRNPELEAVLRERTQPGRFPSVEEALLQALRLSPSSAEMALSEGPQTCTGAELIAALQASPYKEIDLENEVVTLAEIRFGIELVRDPSATPHCRAGSPIKCVLCSKAAFYRLPRTLCCAGGGWSKRVGKQDMPFRKTRSPHCRDGAPSRFHGGDPRPE
jgi:hypothetical protein